MNTKFEYGELYDIHPTLGIDLEEGTIQITGIVSWDTLPEGFYKDMWEIGDASFDFELRIQPWYYIQLMDDDLDPASYKEILPEFALEEVIEKAEKVKARKKETEKKNQMIRSIILG